MNIKVLDAKERFTVLNIGYGQDKNRTAFQCGICSTVMVFTAKNFANNLNTSVSIHTDNIVEKFALKRAIKHDAWEHVMDFKCSNCENPIRLIYMPNEFRMGCSYYQLKTVVEKSNACKIPFGLNINILLTLVYWINT